MSWDGSLRGYWVHLLVLLPKLLPTWMVTAAVVKGAEGRTAVAMTIAEMA